MRLLVFAVALLLVACDSTAPSGTLGLPTTRASAAPTAPPRSGAPATSRANGSASPSASGSAGASASPSASVDPIRPRVVAASATQFVLTVRYSGPMRSATACGAVGQPASLDGAIDRVGGYSSNDDARRESMKSAVSATGSADCAVVTFVFAIAAPAGSFSVSAAGMVDRSGVSEDPSGTTVQLTIADEGRPRVTAASAQSDRIVIEYSEPMRELGTGGIANPASYRLDGNAIDAVNVGCADVGCRKAALTVRRGTLVVGRSYQLRIASVTDRADLSIAPDPTTLTFTAK